MAKPSSPLTEMLKGQQFCLLTTFRKDGSPVPTPMWFALDGETLYMSTSGQSAKVRRLRRAGNVTIGPCNGSGHPMGPQVAAIGRMVETEAEDAAAEAALAARYGLKRKLLMWAMRFAKDKSRAKIAVILA